MAVLFTIRTLRFASGERFPVLVSKETNQPLFEPTVFAVTQLRARNRASNTIEQFLRAVQVFFHFLNLRGIDLDERFRTGRTLDLAEVDELVRLCRLPKSHLSTMLNGEQTRVKSNAVVSIEKYRLRQRAMEAPEVHLSTASYRVRAIRNYLAWMVAERLSRRDFASEAHATLDSAWRATSDALSARIPGPGGRNILGHREGLAPDVISRLREVIRPDSQENPWLGLHARQRNELALYWLLLLGIRRGELLNLKISDIDFRNNVVLITRRADDQADPRLNQPKAKTRDRELVIDETLSRLTQDYMIKCRRTIRGARNHDFLFVADKTGVPLSLNGLNNVFTVLREKCPNLPATLTPHVLRHTWNDAFSELMKKLGKSEAEEVKLRSYAMGWSETSGTAATYTHRYIREATQKASLEMQAEMMKKGKK